MTDRDICKLCGSNSTLLKKSHIIPNFMYQGLQDDLNRMILANLKSFGTKARFRQSGLYESNILCTQCDNVLLSRFENYFSTVLFGGKSSTPPKFDKAISKDGINSVIISNIDYANFKLCLLSILWRAHISSIPFYKNVNIGLNEFEIRNMLLSNDAKEESDYGICIVGLRNRDGLVRMILEPIIVNIGLGQVAIFFINGIFYFIDLKPSSGFKILEKHKLTKTGKLEMMLLEGALAEKFLIAFGLPKQIASFFSNLNA